MFPAIHEHILMKETARSSFVRDHAFHIILALIAHIALSLYLISSSARRNIRSHQFRLFASENACASPPSITSSFLTGVRHKWTRLHQKGDVFNDYMRSVFLAHGPTHAIIKPFTGEVKTVYTIEPENVKTMLSIKFSDYHRPRTMPNALNPVMGQGVFTSNGEAWQHSRGLVKSQFSMKRIRDVAKLEPHLLNIFEALGPANEKGGWTEEQEILPIFNRFTLDSATEFMFGTSAESHEAAMRERDRQNGQIGMNGKNGVAGIIGSLHTLAAWVMLKDASRTNTSKSSNDFWARNGLVMGDFGTAFDVALDYVALRLKLGRLWFLADSIRFRIACYTVKKFADSYIRDAAAHAAHVSANRQFDKETAALDAAEAGDDRRYGLISELIENYPNKIHLRHQILQLLVAGRDTTAATLAWSFILLESHPEIFLRLRSSIISTFGTQSCPVAPVTFSTLRACKYLQWVVFEVVRLYPTGPLNARKASVDTILPVGGGPHGRDPIAVKAGTTVAYNTYLMHRREELWGEDSWSFRPERWEDRKIGWEYIPFHGGPQTCLGPWTKSPRQEGRYWFQHLDHTPPSM